MKKLTLISFMCRRKRFTEFIFLPYVNKKPVITVNQISDRFYHYFGFRPTKGETISQ